MSAKPYYEWLEVSKDASTQVIKRAYRRLALKYHPDKHKGFEQRFREIAEAYEILGDEKKRQQFDRGEVAFDTVFKSSMQVFRECFGDDEEEPVPPIVQVVSPQRIFNLPLFDHQAPIIDTRPAELFAEGHVMNSINLPPGCHLLKLLEEFEAELSPDDYSTIVLIGPSEAEADVHTIQIASALERLIVQPTTTFSEETSVDLQFFHKKLAKSARKEVLIMAGGAPAFQTAYPGCYGQLTRDDCCQTPAHIYGNVFLGSREFLRGHARSHCVSAGIERAIVPSFGGYQEAGGPEIDYFECDADYGDAETTMRCWEPCINYIDASPRRVIIVLHNISPSASVVLAWLVRGKPQFELRTAARLMRRECPRIDWSLAYCEQLVEFDADRKEWLSSHGLLVPAPEAAKDARMAEAAPMSVEVPLDDPSTSIES
eukprot:NODE_4531_length_1880_cov_8.099258.p1 GENE.NODE_4531_length_1880_cov_8.099258~~NODE_4531_length_1880_cov_8.099258.p1  ORF type:complete len:429 (+),score=65.23 NODE_4531_length_1880_cov_8.099258:115-1401(+)